MDVSSSVILFLIFSANVCASKMVSFIVGGSEANIQEFPHSLYLYLACEEPLACGASILTQNILLTAGHCFEHCRKNNELMAYTGSENINKMKIHRKISTFVIHKDYSSRTVYPDIALGYVAKPWKLNTLKRVIITRNPPTVNKAMTAGWGMINDETKETREQLKAAIQTIQPNYICERTGSKMLAGMICTVNYAHRPSRGDSGSALVVNDGHQIGVVSWRSKSMKEVVIYTNVSYHYDWIKEQSRRVACPND